MNRDELLALADRVEALTGPCRWTEGLIFKALHPHRDWVEFDDCWCARCPEDAVAFDVPPQWTRSIDAAMSLAVDDTELVDLLDDAREYTGRQGWATGDFAGQLARNFVAEKLRALARHEQEKHDEQG